MAEKRKMTVIFLIVIVIFTIIVLLPDKQPEVTYSSNEIPSTNVDSTFETYSVSPKEESKAEKVAEETTFWMWEGKESGADSIEYITLRGDGIYILRIELAGREPVDEQGYYKYVNTEKSEVNIPYKGDYVRAVIDDSEMKVGDKTFIQLKESHF